MDWYAVQVLTGKEDEVKAAFDDYGVEMIMPYKPVFLKHAGSLQIIWKPVLPGYIIARFAVTDFYIYKRNRHLEKTMIRICGNGYDTVPLNDSELSFFKCCCEGMEPLKLKADFYDGKNKKQYRIINPPPWAHGLSIEWYDISKFVTKLHISSDGVLKDHAFKIAAYNVDYSGIFAAQLQGLSSERFGKVVPFTGEAVTL